MSHQQIVGVVSRNSISYVQTLFKCYRNQQMVVLLRHADDSRIQQTGVTRVVEPDDAKGWFKEIYVFPRDDALAQIAFTSGTESEPKGVLLTHRALSDVTERLNQVMEVDSTIREYVGVPANFSFGLGRFRAVAAAGGASFLPPHGFDPLEIRELLQSGEINAVSAVPSLWRILLENKRLFGPETASLKWIEIGSQYMSRGEKEQLKSLFPNAIIAQHYGLTEASRTTFLRVDQTHGDLLESVGRVYGQTEVRISDEGRICIRGPHVARQLLKNGEYVTNVDDQGWLRTSDLGRLDQGYLYYEGRADDLINCGGVKLSPDALERDLRDRLSLSEGLAVAAVNDSLTGHAVLITTLRHQSIDETALMNAASEMLLAFGINNKRVIKRLTLDAFPVTDTNKVRRKALAQRYEEQIKAAGPETTSVTQPVIIADLSDDERTILSIWQSVLETEHIGVEDNFYDMGGDSLSALTALIEMERRGVPADISRGLLQGLSIREIAQRMHPAEGVDQQKHRVRGPGMRNSMAINVVRGLMVMSVIIAHWHQGIFERLLGTSAWITSAFAPFFAMGTPGFAVIYGVGAGYALFPLFFNDETRLKGILKKTFLLLLTGILLLGAAIFWAKWRNNPGLTFTDFTNSFYSVLTYYLLVTATLYPIFWLLTKSQYPVLLALVLSMCSYAIDYLLMKQIADDKAEGLVELAKLLLTAKYAYFQMLSGSLMGMAIGISIQRWLSKGESLNVLNLAGLFVLLAGIIVSLHQPDAGNWFNWPVSANNIWRWLVYTGLVMLLLAWMESLLRRYEHMSRTGRFALQFAAVTGMLAFPMFVLHEMVIPMKSVLTSYGSSGVFSMAVALALFVTVSGYLFLKLYRASYG
ncbi:MAG: AMP-binding protein [Candidatus Contendobacter sp.]|nr:AMP-binding protein [Candidatus Contendobacter sp.]